MDKEFAHHGQSTSTLLVILAGCTGDQPQRLAQHSDRYGKLKQAIADAVVVATRRPAMRSPLRGCATGR